MKVRKNIKKRIVLDKGPKAQICIEISKFIILWYFLGVVMAFNKDFVYIKIGSIFVIAVLIILNGLYGPTLACCHSNKGKIYTLPSSGFTGVGVLSRRVGSYNNGIIVDELILSKDEIFKYIITKEGL